MPTTSDFYQKLTEATQGAAKPRTINSGSPEANARDKTAPGTASSPRSSSVIRPGFSDCADLNSPRTDATVRSTAAPRATITNRESANRSSPNHSCTNSRAHATAA